MITPATLKLKMIFWPTLGMMDPKAYYWSFQTHTDANSDGIVDAPLTLETNNIDHYPSTEPINLYILTVEIEGSGQTNFPAGENYALKNSVVEVTATPVEGGAFYNWILDGVNHTGTSSISVTMNQDRSLTAAFMEVRYTLTIEFAAPWKCLFSRRRPRGA